MCLVNKGKEKIKTLNKNEKLNYNKILNVPKTQVYYFTTSKSIQIEDKDRKVGEILRGKIPVVNK